MGAGANSRYSHLLGMAWSTAPEPGPGKTPAIVLENADGTEAGWVPMTTVGELFEVGPTHDLIGYPAGGDPRAAFTLHL